MTAIETIQLVRLLVDDSLDFYSELSVIEDMLNRAQLQKIYAYYSMGDERAMRTLYEVSDLLDDGDDAPDMIAPRSARIYPNDLSNENVSRQATFVEHPKFAYWSGAGWGSSGVVETAWYSLYGGKVHFNKGDDDQRLRLWYLKVPPTFTKDQPLILPEEYQVEVVLLAAQLLAETDPQEADKEAIEDLGTYLRANNDTVQQHDPRGGGTGSTA